MEEKKLSIEVPSEVAGGHYSNLAILSHSQSEFVLDFAQMLPGNEKAQVRSRIIMTPDHVKRLLNALVENIGKYENQFGRIDFGEGPKGTLNLADFIPGEKS